MSWQVDLSDMERNEGQKTLEEAAREEEEYQRLKREQKREDNEPKIYEAKACPSCKSKMRLSRIAFRDDMEYICPQCD